VGRASVVPSSVDTDWRVGVKLREPAGGRRFVDVDLAEDGERRRALKSSVR